MGLQVPVTLTCIATLIDYIGCWMHARHLLRKFYTVCMQMKRPNRGLNLTEKVANIWR